MLRLSLRARVLAGMAVIVVALAVVAFVVTATTRAYLIDQVDARLDGGRRHGPGRQLRRTRARVPTDGGPGGPPDRPSDVYVGVIGGDGRAGDVLRVRSVR